MFPRIRPSRCLALVSLLLAQAGCAADRVAHVGEPGAIRVESVATVNGEFAITLRNHGDVDARVIVRCPALLLTTDAEAGEQVVYAARQAEQSSISVLERAQQNAAGGIVVHQKSTMSHVDIRVNERREVRVARNPSSAEDVVDYTVVVGVPQGNGRTP